MRLSDHRNRYLQRQLQKQIEENLRLRLRIDELNRELGTLRSSKSSAVSAEVWKTFEQHANTRRLFALRNYPSYMMARLRSTSLWSLWQKALGIARRYRLLTTTFRVITLIITWVETSAVVLLSLTVTLIAMVPMLLGGLVVLILGMFQHSRCNEELSTTLANRKIYVCVADKRALREQENYFRGMVHALASDPQAAVIVVSPFFWRSCGIGEHRAFVTLRHESQNIYLIRRHYFFSLRKHVLHPFGEHVTMIY